MVVEEEDRKHLPTFKFATRRGRLAREKSWVPSEHWVHRAYQVPKYPRVLTSQYSVLARLGLSRTGSNSHLSYSFRVAIETFSFC